MMAGDCIAPPATLGGPAHHVSIWPIVLNKVHVHRREMLKSIAEVSAKSHGLEEDLGQEHCRAEIDVHTSLEIGHKRTEGEKISMRRSSCCLAIKRRVHMDDVCPYRDMDCHRNPQARARCEQALVLIRKIPGLYHPAHCSTDSLVLGGGLNILNQHAARLLGHAKSAGADLSVDGF